LMLVYILVKPLAIWREYATKRYYVQGAGVMKKNTMVILALLFICFQMQIFANKAIDVEGKIVLLHENGTWAYEERTAVPVVQVPSEKDLYNMIKYDNDDVLLELYLDHYEGDDLKNTISVIYHYCFLKPDTEEFDLWVLKGIAYTAKLGSVFMITVGPFERDFVSNLFFYWNFAESMERKGRYSEALQYYEALKIRILETDGKYTYSVIDSSLDQVTTKIFKMNLLLSKQKP